MPWTLKMILYTFGLALIPYIYTSWRLINAFTLIYPKYRRSFRIGIPLIFTLFNLMPVIAVIFYLFGEYRSLFFYSDQFSTFDIFLLYPYWISLIIIVESFPYLLATDILLLISRWFSLTIKANLVRALALVKIVVFVFIVIFVPIRIYIDTNAVDISTYEVPIKRLPPEIEQLSLVLTADVQVDRFTPQGKIARFIKQVESLSPDIIFFAGDLVTDGTSFIDEGVRSLCRIGGTVDRIACVGDHDIWSDANRIAQGLQQCGWKFLDDRHHIIEQGDKRILVTGVSFVYSKRISPPRLEALLASAPEADLKILLVHQPKKMIINTASKYGYDLVLAGHTHGGQIIFRPFGFTLTPTQMENDIYSGMYRQNGVTVIITNGIGMSLVPIRYRAKGEIVHIKLVNQN